MYVPKANDTLTALCDEWAAKEKVDIKIEAQAKTGHDILAFPTWHMRV
jgi:hypothetical protein